MPKWVRENIQKILEHLPQTPGVYQVKDANGKVIYVGKSVNLRSRVGSYFREQSVLSAAKSQMVKKIADIEVILCQTEVEALVLETNLIKHLSPKYNILMKDDKNLAYIKITHSPVAEVYKTRQKIPDGSEYFGPYTQWASIHQSLGLLKKIFRIRSCKMHFREQRDAPPIITDRAGKTPPCMDYYIGLCPGPCLLTWPTITAHEDHVAELRRFLRWDAQSVLDGIESRMYDHARRQEFEEAQKLKEQRDALKVLTEKQLARDILPGDHDIVVSLEKYGWLHVGLTQIRDGKIIGVFRTTIESGIEEASDMLAAFLARQYISEDALISPPESIVTRIEIMDPALLEYFREKHIVLDVPSRGPKQELLDFTQNQLREYAYKKELQSLESKTLTREHMQHVLSELWYTVPKKGEITFECYDISHTHGQFTYASRVLIANGKPDTDRYKKYKIKTLWEGMIDDFASHREVMFRRTLEGIREGNFPDLIIIDGGKGQLSSAILGIESAIDQITEEQGGVCPSIPRPQICSIAKREEEVFLPENPVPVMFEKGTPELMVLQKARDESHRFSITANRQARTKEMKKNILEELPGIGPITRKKLLKIAGSIDGIREMSESDLLSVCTRSQIETLRDHGILWT